MRNDLFELANLAGASVVLFAFVPLLLALAIPYLVLRLRPGQGEDVDPQVGIKAVLHFGFSLSILMILGGVTYLVVDALLEKKPPAPAQPFGVPGQFQPQPQRARADRDFTAGQRAACALLVSGFAIGLLHLVLLLGFTNDRNRPEARRVFVGWRLAIHTLVIITAFTALVVEMFRVETNVENVKAFLGILVVWGPSWAVHLVLLRIYRFANYRPRPLRLTLGEESET